MNVSYRDAVPGAGTVRELYDAVGWTAYTNDMDALLAGLENSTRVVTAWIDDQLVGLARVISDSATIAYVQDILVNPSFRRRGIATELLRLALESFDVRQTVLLTDADPAQQSFYESAGFTEICDVGPDGLRSFVRFR